MNTRISNERSIHDAGGEPTCPGPLSRSAVPSQTMALFLLTPAAWELARLLVVSQASAWLERLSANHNETMVRDVSSID